MKRREFSSTTLAAAAGLAWPGRAPAQGGPVEGRHYVRLSQPVPVSAPPGQFEVIDFFWYGCPHCYAFEPALEAWVKQLPQDVAFRRVPVAFTAEPYVEHQHLYYALESLGLVEQMHRRVFYAIHNEHKRLDKPAEISAFVTQYGIDAVKFMEAYGAFGTQAKVRQADHLVDAYKIDGVPSIGVHGRFYTSGALAGDNERSLVITDYLLQRLRNKLN